MNNVNINVQDFVNTKEYKNFISDNPSKGYLKIRAYAASEAIPISGLKVVVSTPIGNNNVIFFEGETNSSGLIDKIALPTPKLDSNNLDVPNNITYEIAATYTPDNVKQVFKVKLYENVCVVQNINIIPDMNLKMGES